MSESQGFISVTDPLPPSSVDPNNRPQQQQQGMVGDMVALFKRSSHPTASLFHVLFKLSALVFYFTSGFFTSSFVIVFVVVVLLMAFDFWTVKNITGRLMVGLRWWNDVREDGRAEWHFESIEDQSQVSRADYAIFWYSMYLTAFLWGLFGFLALIGLKLDWMLVCGVALVLVWSNIYGYWQCSNDARSRAQQGMQSVLASGAMAAMTGTWTAPSFGGGASAGGAAGGRV
jgi:hypothetical protein